MKKRKLTPQQQRLKAEFEAMMAKHQKPLERGAIAKGQAVKTAPPSKRGTPLFESTRVSTEASVDTGQFSTAPRQQVMYTGDKVLGVALMHKSSYAPVFDTKSAEEISKMRR
jgi:hypothetical protein